MRTEAELKEAIRHLEQARNSPEARMSPMQSGMFSMLIDALQWVSGKTGTRFEAMVIEPCRRVDRAEKASEN